jgi:predicted dehydrogenase
MAGFVDIGEYYKWKKRRTDGVLTPDFLSSLSVLVVGGGSVGKRHLGNLHGLGIAKIAAVDPREDRRREITDQFPGCRVFELEEHAYREGRYDIVVVANPPVFHVRSGIAAIKAGAHLLMEKSISDSVDGTAEMLTLADASRRQVGVCYMYRFFDTIQYIKRLLEEGSLGKVYSMQTVFSEYLPGWHPWEKPSEWYAGQAALGGSELLDENHTIDYARWFFGDIEAVSGFVGRLGDVTVDADDFAELTCFHSSGVVTQIHQDALGRKPRKDMWITGEHGTLFWDSYMGGNRVEWFQADRGRTEVFHGRTSRNDAFFEHLRDFLYSVATGAPPAITGWDALRTLEICVAARQSSAERRTVSVPGATD